MSINTDFWAIRNNRITPIFQREDDLQAKKEAEYDEWLRQQRIEERGEERPSDWMPEGIEPPPLTKHERNLMWTRSGRTIINDAEAYDEWRKGNYKPWYYDALEKAKETENQKQESHQQLESVRQKLGEGVDLDPVSPQNINEITEAFPPEITEPLYNKPPNELTEDDVETLGLIGEWVNINNTGVPESMLNTKRIEARNWIDNLARVEERFQQDLWTEDLADRPWTHEDGTLNTNTLITATNEMIEYMALSSNNNSMAYFLGLRLHETEGWAVDSANNDSPYAVLTSKGNELGIVKFQNEFMARVIKEWDKTRARTEDDVLKDKIFNTPWVSKLTSVPKPGIQDIMRDVLQDMVTQKTKSDKLDYMINLVTPWTDSTIPHHNPNLSTLEDRERHEAAIATRLAAELDLKRRHHQPIELPEEWNMMSIMGPYWDETYRPPMLKEDPVTETLLERLLPWDKADAKKRDDERKLLTKIHDQVTMFSKNGVPEDYSASQIIGSRLASETALLKTIQDYKTALEQGNDARDYQYLASVLNSLGLTNISTDIPFNQTDKDIYLAALTEAIDSVSASVQGFTESYHRVQNPLSIYDTLMIKSMNKWAGTDFETMDEINSLIDDVLDNPDGYDNGSIMGILSTYNLANETFSDFLESDTADASLLALQQKIRSNLAADGPVDEVGNGSAAFFDPSNLLYTEAIVKQNRVALGIVEELQDYWDNRYRKVFTDLWNASNPNAEKPMTEENAPSILNVPGGAFGEPMNWREMNQFDRYVMSEMLIRDAQQNPTPGLHGGMESLQEWLQSTYSEMSFGSEMVSMDLDRQANLHAVLNLTSNLITQSAASEGGALRRSVRELVAGDDDDRWEALSAYNVMLQRNGIDTGFESIDGLALLRNATSEEDRQAVAEIMADRMALYTDASDKLAHYIGKLYREEPVVSGLDSSTDSMFNDRRTPLEGDPESWDTDTYMDIVTELRRNNIVIPSDETELADEWARVSSLFPRALDANTLKKINSDPDLYEKGIVAVLYALTNDLGQRQLCDTIVTAALSTSKQPLTPSQLINLSTQINGLGNIRNTGRGMIHKDTISEDTERDTVTLLETIPDEDLAFRTGGHDPTKVREQTPTEQVTLMWSNYTGSPNPDDPVIEANLRRLYPIWANERAKELGLTPREMYDLESDIQHYRMARASYTGFDPQLQFDRGKGRFLATEELGNLTYEDMVSDPEKMERMKRVREFFGGAYGSSGDIPGGFQNFGPKVYRAIDLSWVKAPETRTVIMNNFSRREPFWNEAAIAAYGPDGVDRWFNDMEQIIDNTIQDYGDPVLERDLLKLVLAGENPENVMLRAKPNMLDLHLEIMSRAADHFGTFPANINSTTLNGMRPHHPRKIGTGLFVHRKYSQASLEAIPLQGSNALGSGDPDRMRMRLTIQGLTPGQGERHIKLPWSITDLPGMTEETKSGDLSGFWGTDVWQESERGQLGRGEGVGTTYLESDPLQQPVRTFHDSMHDFSSWVDIFYGTDPYEAWVDKDRPSKPDKPSTSKGIYIPEHSDLERDKLPED